MTWDISPRNVLAEIYGDDFTAALRDIGLSALRGVILKTPVDTGRLRGGWFVTIDAPSEKITNEVDKSGGVTISKGATEIQKIEMGQTLILQNNVEYGIFINDGTDKIAPRRMIERTVEELVGAFGN